MSDQHTSDVLVIGSGKVEIPQEAFLAVLQVGKGR